VPPLTAPPAAADTPGVMSEPLDGVGGRLALVQRLGGGEELFRTLTDHAPVGVLVSDARGSCIYVNRRWCELAGLDAGEALGEGWPRALYPDDSERVLAEWRAASTAGRDSIAEFRFRRPDGSVRSVQGFASPLREDGEVTGWVGTCLDLTARVRRERQQQAIAELGVFALSDPAVEALLSETVVTVGRELGVEFASYLELEADAAAAVLRAAYGWQPAGEPVVAPLEGASPAAQALRARGPVLVEHTNANGDGRGDLLRAHEVASSAAVLVGAGLERPFGVLSAHSTRAGAFEENDLFFLGSIAHVLAAALARSQATESARRLAAIVESSSDAIIGRTLDGIVTTWNAAAERLTGYRAEEVIGKPFADIISAGREVELQAANARLARGELVEPFETDRLRKDGSSVAVEISAWPVTSRDGSVVGVSTLARDISQRKQAEADLRASEARARAIVDSALDAVVTIDSSGAIVEFNPAAEAIFGYRRDEVIGRSMSECLIPPSLRERHTHSFRRAAETGVVSILGRREFVGLRSDGSEFPIELAVSRVSADGPPVFTAFIRDLSERKRSEKTRLEFAAIAESTSDAIIGKTLDGIVTSWNAAAETIYGYRAEEAIGHPIEFIVPADRHPELASLLDRVRNGERVHNLETVRIRKDGTAVEVALSLSPIVDTAGRPIGSSAIARDISERKRAQNQLRRSEARYRDLFENATDLIAVVDLESRLTDMNTAFATALGYSRDELIGRPISEFVPDESHALLADAREAKLASRREATVYEHDLIARDGSRIQVEVASRLLFEDGQPVGTEAICRDITERTRLEQELRVAQKMEAIGQLAGGIAHDFNNLLLIIRTCSELLLARIDDAELRPDLTEIDRAAQRATELTRQLLAFGRRQVLQPQVTDLHEQLEDMLQLLHRTIGENIAVDYQPGADVPFVHVDRSQLSQVILNLAVNARDAMPNGGSLTIRTEAASNPDGALAGRYALLQIADTGIGIPAADQRQIFDPFFTTKEHGSGLGLATVHGIITQSSGHITVSSAPGDGATFSIYLPAVARPVHSTAWPVAPPTALEGQETILLVEDEETIRRKVATALRGYGYTVFEAGNGEEALSLLASAGWQIDLLLSDIVMPGINGRELADRVRAHNPGIRVLLTSGYPADTLADDRSLVDIAYIQKPYLPNELAGCIRELIDSQPLH
jgi:two-component system cell cycle sensor histidine kinase/response regulator CckA